MANYRYETLDKKIIDFYKEVFLVIGYSKFHYAYNNNNNYTGLRAKEKWRTFLETTHPKCENTNDYDMASRNHDETNTYFIFNPHFIDWLSNE